MFENGDIDFRYFGMGDDAYPVSDQLITPVPGTKLTEAEDNFNFFQSSLRIRIECAFGRLVARWGVLQRPLKCKFQMVAPIVFACMILHNLCFDDSHLFAHDDIDHVTPFYLQQGVGHVPDAMDGNPEIHDQADCYSIDDSAEGLENRHARASIAALNRHARASTVTRRSRLVQHLQNNHPGMKRPAR